MLNNNQEHCDYNDANQVVNACVFTENTAAVAVGLMALGVIKAAEIIANGFKWVYRKIQERREPEEAYEVYDD